MIEELGKIEYKKGEFLVFFKHGHDDFSVWMTDDLDDELSGGSIRGTKNEIIEECVDECKELLTVEELERILK